MEVVETRQSLRLAKSKDVGITAMASTQVGWLGFATALCVADPSLQVNPYAFAAFSQEGTAPTGYRASWVCAGDQNVQLRVSECFVPMVGTAQYNWMRVQSWDPQGSGGFLAHEQSSA